jgi:hypothetical protein
MSETGAMVAAISFTASSMERIDWPNASQSLEICAIAVS